MPSIIYLVFCSLLLVESIAYADVIDNPRYAYEHPKVSGEWITLYSVLVNATVPEFVDDFEKNLTGIIVKYPNRTCLVGADISYYHAIEDPWIDWFPEKNKFYTVIMIDGDAPKRVSPTWRELLLLLVVNIPHNVVENGRVIAEYVPPNPQPSDGVHRIIVFLFRQRRRQRFIEPFYSKKRIEERRNFKTRNFAEKYKLGNPVGGVYFHTRWRTKEDVMKSEEEMFRKLPRGFSGKLYANTLRTRDWDYNLVNHTHVDPPHIPTIYDYYSDSS